MQYLEAAIELKKLIRKVNHLQMQKETTVLSHKNAMFLFLNDKSLLEVTMKEFTNDFVNAVLDQHPETRAFVMTDMAAMDLKGQKLTYWLFKGYHRGMEKGMVYFQPIDELSLQKNGRLQFSNLEENIFLRHQAPAFEESSCNAMETEEQQEGEKSIVFLIGNMDENRLLYDIERLIVDTASNVQKHKSLAFKCILNISKFGGLPSNDFLERLNAIEKFTRQEVAAEYGNCRFSFELES
ncbi:hypothetical protein [Mangrovibacterium marinum]|uniref:Uncharacterized protein n=1 Tax=Mangrovibacterium marinum TaxID=1639118 RepID=A0A2T5C0B4_9BACT|nr:hypothetical protein [Mangrovibacterium marinum]PTN08012.1 hypothetical protein C8N47_11152 [Mangrovibacterium marinum]